MNIKSVFTLAEYLLQIQTSYANGSISYEQFLETAKELQESYNDSMRYFAK